MRIGRKNRPGTIFLLSHVLISRGTALLTAGQPNPVRYWLGGRGRQPVEQSLLAAERLAACAYATAERWWSLRIIAGSNHLEKLAIRSLWMR